MAHGSQGLPKIPDGQISRVRFQTLACHRRPSQSLERFKRWFVYTPATPGLPTASPPKPSSACRRFYQAGRLDDRESRQVSRAPLPNSGVTSVGETCSVSWEKVTSPSSLVLAHAPLPLGSPRLQLLASCRESLQVVTSPCCPRQLPDVISDSLCLDAGSPTPAVHRVLAPVSSTVSSAFPKGKWVGFPQLSRLKRLRAGGIFEVADISLCSGLQVCSPPRSSLPLRILPQGSRGFYVRAERGSLPPRASDMLTA